MINYKINNYQIIKLNTEPETNCYNHIFVLDSDEFKNSSLFKNYVNQKYFSTKHSRLEIHPDYIFNSIAVPDKTNIRNFTRINLFIINENIFFIDNTDYVVNIIEKIIKDSNTDMSISRFLFKFLNSLIENDLIFLENIEEQLSLIEQDILNGITENFNKIIVLPKGKIFTFYRFYNHLLDTSESLESIDNLFNTAYEKKLISLLISRVRRLKSETGYLKEYMLQIQQLYQAQTESKQNDIMKILTIVTTTVLPLSLIAGWYGMNFEYMPELMWKYGYVYAIVLSIIVVLISLIIFKKKRYW